MCITSQSQMVLTVAPNTAFFVTTEVLPKESKVWGCSEFTQIKNLYKVLTIKCTWLFYSCNGWEERELEQLTGPKAYVGANGCQPLVQGPPSPRACMPSNLWVLCHLHFWRHMLPCTIRKGVWVVYGGGIPSHMQCCRWKGKQEDAQAFGEQ